MPLGLFGKLASAIVVAAALAGIGVLALSIARTNTSEHDTAAPSETPPLIGDHWHAAYRFFVCGQQQPPFPDWDAGIDTHGDGLMHLHPEDAADEGSGARLTKWVEYGGGKLDADGIQAPGSGTTYADGDTCPDGSEATLNVWVNTEQIDPFARYIPQDGDRIVISFGPSGEALPGAHTIE